MIKCLAADDAAQVQHPMLRHLLKHQPLHYVKNAPATFYVVQFDGLEMPLTVTTHQADSKNASYVTSVFSHYIGYALDEVALVPHRGLQIGLTLVIRLMALLFNVCRINQVVMVNNFLFSTNLYPTLTTAQLQALDAFLTQRFPGAVLLFRSCNPMRDHVLLETLEACQYQRLPYRQIFLQAPATQLASRSRTKLRTDLKQLQLHGFTFSSIQSRVDLIPQIQTLYEQLYLQKYSHFNPQFTTAFFETSMTTGFIQYYGLFQADTLIGVVGYYVLGDQMTTPILGYDLAYPASYSVYFMLTGALIDLAYTQGLKLNNSSGASRCKLYRGAVETLEYCCVKTTTASFLQKIGYRCLRTVVNRLAVPIIQHYDF